ncbi:MAG: acyl-CoA dehydrogenase family protein [Thermoleophilaceae bacterium]|nr:acyl-CoA dehydrogenase family protein [Thermoleophilaceae bacterium]
MPPFTEEHGELRASVRRFVARELRPHATAWEDARWFPPSVHTSGSPRHRSGSSARR